MTSVSIGIPYTDQTDELALAIQSVLGQSHEDWELILVGDGPSPEASAVARSFQDRRMRLDEQPVRIGLAATLNRISRLAKFPLLARMDGDDVMHPNRIARQVQEFNSDSSLDVLGTNAYLIDERTRLVGAFKEPRLPANGPGFLRSNAFSHPTVMGRTSWFRNNPYDESLLRAQDKELWLRTWPESKFAKLPDRLMYYRVPRTMSASKLRRNEFYNRQILMDFIQNEESRLNRAKLMGTSYCKQALFLAAEVGIVARYLYNRKWATLSRGERLEAQSLLNQVAASQSSKPPHSS